MTDSQIPFPSDALKASYADLASLGVDLNPAVYPQPGEKINQHVTSIKSMPFIHSEMIMSRLNWDSEMIFRPNRRPSRTHPGDGRGPCVLQQGRRLHVNLHGHAQHHLATPAPLVSQPWTWRVQPGAVDRGNMSGCQHPRAGARVTGLRPPNNHQQDMSVQGCLSMGRRLCYSPYHLLGAWEV